VGQVDLITEPILNSHEQYYEILKHYVSREYQLGTQEAERLIHQLNKNKVANKSIVPKPRAFLKGPLNYLVFMLLLKKIYSQEYSLQVNEP
jgi:hypothetical protein